VVEVSDFWDDLLQEIDDLKAERDALKARVAELERWYEICITTHREMNTLAKKEAPR